MATITPRELIERLDVIASAALILDAQYLYAAIDLIKEIGALEGGAILDLNNAEIEVNA